MALLVLSAVIFVGMNALSITPDPLLKQYIFRTGTIIAALGAGIFINFKMIKNASIIQRIVGMVAYILIFPFAWLLVGMLLLVLSLHFCTPSPAGGCPIF